MTINQDLPTLADVEREYTIARLEYFGGNKTSTAKSLGISPKTLYLRLGRYGISAPDFRKLNVVRERTVYNHSRAEKRRSTAVAKLCAKARISSLVSKAVRDLIDAPLAQVVGMSATDRRVAAKATKSKPRKCRYGESSKPMARWLEMRL